MRRICYAVAMSLDAYIAGSGGEFDWIVPNPEIDFGAIFARFDTFLMGRRTYEVTMAGGGAAMMAGKEVVVASWTMRPEDHPGVTIISDGLEEAVDRLRREPGKDIWLFGGGELFRVLLDAGLVDAVEVAVIPVLLGGGIPLLPSPAHRARLRLVASKVYKSGTMALEYAVER